MRKKNPKWHTEYQKQSPEQLRKAQAAKIVDCPQNAIELRKLLNTWQDIDRVKKRVLNKMNSEKYLTMLKYRELLTGETSGWLDENLLLPPGFRYHANGDDKKVRPSIRSLTVVSSKVDNQSVKANVSSLSTQSRSVNKKHSKSNVETDIEQEIKETERALDEIKTDRQLHAINRKISNVKKSLTFLKAHSSNSLYDRNLKGRGPTPRLSATKCDACFTRLKWSADNLKYPKGRSDSHNSTINRPWLPSSPSMRSTSSSMGNLGSNVHSRMPPAPRNSPNNISTKSPQKKNSNSVTCLDSPPRTPQNSSSDFKTLAERLKNKLGVKGSSSCSSASVGSLEGRSPMPKTGDFRESPTGRSNSTASELSVTSNTPRPRGPTPNKARLTRDGLKCVSRPNSNPCLETQSVQSVSPSKESRTNRTTNNKTHSKEKMNARSDDVLKMKFSEEDRYRHVMSKACISDQQKLETLSAMFEGAGLLDSGKKELDKSSHCRIRATHRSVPGITIGRSSSENTRGNLAAARKTRLELEAKCSRDKVEDFLRRLPTPNVTIRRWRTSTGEIQMIKSTAPPANANEPDVTSQDAGSDVPEVDDLESAEQVDCNGSDSDGRESPDSETLLMNTSLTSWPTHWAQRAVFQSRDKVNDDVVEQENSSPNSLKEFRKLSRCRYLRIPPGVLTRYQSTGSKVSPQAWD